MFLRLFKLQVLKAVRSVSLGRKLIAGVILGFFGFIILVNILLLGFGLRTIIERLTGRADVIIVVNNYLVFFFLLEMMYRFFLQKVSVIELENYLHLPIRRSKIIHFLLLRSFVSPFNLIPILLFTPVYVDTVKEVYGTSRAIFWLLTIIMTSWSLHWLMLWFKQKYGDRVIGIILLFTIFLAGCGSAWYGWFNIGTVVAPFFTASLHSSLPYLLMLVFFVGTYLLAYQYYKKHAYLEEIGTREKMWVMGDNISLFNRFGLAGAVADLELKLILRHKKSRNYLILTVLFLAYGLFFYTDGSFTLNDGIPGITILVGTFITGLFIMNYGQLFLSWNSPHFDFFLTREGGIDALVKGKYLLFFGISLGAFILALPYVYYGWMILAVHTATFLFNLGINIHIIIYLALWKPKPMDLHQGSMFNYEGMGAAQFLMGIPMLGLPYLVYLPTAYFASEMMGLIALGTVGVFGIIFNEDLIRLQVSKIRKSKYAISSSFRQEI